MGMFHDSMNEQLAKQVWDFQKRIVREKLLDQGVVDETIVEQLADAILEAESDVVEIPSAESIEIELTKKDVQRLKRYVAKIRRSLPNLVDQISDDLAEGISRDLKEQWRQSAAVPDRSAEFRERILKDWARPLDSLRLLVTHCFEEGDRFNKAHLKSRRSVADGRDEAISRLHIRACRIAEEILLLLENGYTEGAQARWRTLHEIEVAAMLIAQGGDVLARRYFDHEIVDQKKELDDHRRSAKAAGVAPSFDGNGAEIQRRLAAAVRKYGRSFKGQFGWASDQLGIPSEPHFHHLQEAAASLERKQRYRISSFGVHASPKSLSQPVHHWDPTTHVPGTFAAGFEGPATDTIRSIAEMTMLLYPQPYDLDSLIFIKVLGRLAVEAYDEWFAAAKAIDERERASMERAIRSPLRRRPLNHEKAKPGRRRV